MAPGTLAYRAYGRDEIQERHRHRYELNNAFEAQLAASGLIASGRSPDGQLVEICERTDHPFMIGSQFHPEFLSRPLRPHPLFREFLAAALRYAGQLASAPEATVAVPTDALVAGGGS